MSNDRYTSPLSERYASKEMQYIFSPDKKFRTWRKLWIALAETEKELGLDITEEQIEELKAHADRAEMFLSTHCAAPSAAVFQREAQGYPDHSQPPAADSCRCAHRWRSARRAGRESAPR